MKKWLEKAMASNDGKTVDNDYLVSFIAGSAIGRADVYVEFAKKLIDSNYSAEEIAHILSLSDDETKMLKEVIGT